MNVGVTTIFKDGHARGVWTSNTSRLSPLFTRRGCASYAYC